jgi:hypothetical protein
MKNAGLLFALCLLPGCIPSEQARGLPTVSSNQLGTPPPSTLVQSNYPNPDSDLAGKVLKLGRDIAVSNKNSGLDPNLTFVTYPSPTVEIFHLDRTHVIVTEGLARKCNHEQLAAMLALELGKLAVERQVASPYLDSRSFVEPPVHVQVSDPPPPPPSELVDLAHHETEQRARKNDLPQPRQLAQAFLRKAGFSEGCLEIVRSLVEEAGANHNVEMRLKGLPSRTDWQPLN